MACCVIIVTLIVQLLEAWRRIRRTGGALAAAGNERANALRSRVVSVMRRPIARCALALAVAAEVLTVAPWLWHEHSGHLAEVTAASRAWIGAAGLGAADICTSATAQPDSLP